MDCLLYPAASQPDPLLIQRLRDLRTSLVSDSFDRWSGPRNVRLISGLRPRQTVAGPAFTVRTRPGDNLVLHKALELAAPGDVIVVAAGEHEDRALLGGLMGFHAAQRGIAALVTDGAVRDVSDLVDRAPPVFAAGVNHLGPYKSGPGELRGPISLGGVVVCNGDLVLGDEDGIVIIPRHRAGEIITASEAKRAAEALEEEAIELGRWDRSWLDHALTIREVPAAGQSPSWLTEERRTAE